MDASFPTDVTSQFRPQLTQVVVAVPVRNEARLLPRLLSALSGATRRSALPVTALVFANNCIDESAAIGRAHDDPLLAVEVQEAELVHATAGAARRLAFDIAAREGALILTTDGDAIPHPDWIAAALRTADAGADIVCGRITADCRRVLATPSGQRTATVEGAYAALLHETRHAIDRIAGRQGPARPHYIESGASLAIRADAYRMIGGMPAVRSSEDRALVHRAESHGLTVRYENTMTAVVSARLHGRAEGGMAEALRQRMHDPDPLVDQAMLPPAIVAQLWARTVAGCAPPFPSRAEPVGPRMRTSALEDALPELRRFVEATVRPHLIHRRVAA
ncbi:glycosyltransferase family 2 protein [Cereibacter sp. SYSU M97828]|nr:glycosyltransferase family 2 protein [Cereibacter flavus]